MQNYDPKTEARNHQHLLEMAHEKKLQSLKFDSHLPKTIIPIVQELRPQEPYFQLRIVQSDVPLEAITTQYYVTPRGVLGSLRRSSEDVMIGRQIVNEHGLRLNDIVLCPTDTSISRQHARINYKDYFHIGHSDLTNFYMFQLISKHHDWKLPTDLAKWIWACLRPSRRLYISDMGTILGTFIKCKPESPQTIEDGSLFQTDSYILMLCKIRRGNVVLDSWLDGIFASQRTDLMHAAPVSTLLFEVIRAGSNRECFRFEYREGDIEGNSDSELVFELGRSRSNILSTSIRIAYSRAGDTWTLRLLNHEQYHPLWRCTSVYQESRDRYEPREVQLYDQDEIKVSETIFKLILRS